jgi:outer membrane protein TolC
MTGVAGKAGLQSTATVALAEGSAAEAASALAQRRALCDISVKGLVALTALDEPALRKLLARPGPPRLPEPRQFKIESIPAQVVSQRPDVAAAERRLAAASADIGHAEADRYPRLTLSGNILPTRMYITPGPAFSLTTWSIGPSLVLPLFDGGRRTANVDAYKAQYAAADAVYRAKVRDAVREVEEALVRLDSAAAREADTATSARGYRANLAAAQAKLQAGLGSVLELEDARRLSIAADATLDTLAQERVAAWIALYRAAGGGWEPEPPNRTSP